MNRCPIDGGTVFPRAGWYPRAWMRDENGKIRHHSVTEWDEYTGPAYCSEACRNAGERSK